MRVGNLVNQKGAKVMRKILAVAALALAGSVAMAPAAHAYDGDDTVNTLINGDLGSNICVAPWNWEGPGLILSTTGDYVACVA